MKPPRSLLAALLVALAGMLSAQTTDRSAPPSRLAGNWRVAYEDLALGEIDGIATISADGKKATVSLTTGAGGASYTLTSESITEQGDDYTVVLTGESPSAPGLMPDANVAQQGAHAAQDALSAVMATYGAKAPPTLIVAPVPQLQVAAPLHEPKWSWAYGQPNQPPDVHLAVPGDSGTLGLEVADYRATLPFKPMHPVEARRVVLTLHFKATSDTAGYAGAAGDLLTGTWKYYADPVTWRDGEGKGRVGYFRRDSENTNLTTQSAAEVWFRPNPPAQMQFIALGAFGEIRIKHLFPGVPTIVEAIFDAPQDEETILIEVQVGAAKIPMPAHRDPDDARRFTTDPFLPGSDTRPAPSPSARPALPDETASEKDPGI